ncbi:hypothetical protein QBC46DRAFT_382020 [Diplogelasinospora grovesii]|uniref:J domain-containing protein n=1 Tax=Diplogelasinospora grovesii TaxID=303347 RepID=A0AAN6NAR0_9PEZI|nr:hypothetical protein QBC46DRAFT_382020 [Diplogelasinospora grovesii]
MSAHEDDLMDGEPPVIDPYEVLGLEREATADQVKSAYRKAALKNHPDKVSEDKKDEAKEKFQTIAFAYAVLSDPARRKRYDETGSTSESIVDSDGFSWTDFYREAYKDAISEDAIEKFAKQYKGSDEEKDDILAAYEEFEGDMDKIYETVMLSNVLEDDERIRKVIDDAIEEGEVEKYTKYTKETKKKRQARVKAAQAESKEADEYAKELGVYEKLRGNGKKTKKDSEADLAALILGRQQQRGSMIDRIAEKYGAKPKQKKEKETKEGKGGSSRGKKRKVEVEEEPEIDEEEFQAIQANMMRKSKKRRT